MAKQRHPHRTTALGGISEAKEQHFMFTPQTDRTTVVLKQDDDESGNNDLSDDDGGSGGGNTTNNWTGPIMVIVLLLTFVVMYAHLFLTSTNDGSTFHFDDDAFREFPQGIPRGQSHVRQRDTPLREERDGTELFARHFSRRRDYDFIATDEFNINEIDDDDDDDDDDDAAATSTPAAAAAAAAARITSTRWKWIQLLPSCRKAGM
jgi:hypothetical protein